MANIRRRRGGKVTENQIINWETVHQEYLDNLYDNTIEMSYEECAEMSVFSIFKVIQLRMIKIKQDHCG